MLSSTIIRTFPRCKSIEYTCYNQQKLSYTFWKRMHIILFYYLCFIFFYNITSTTQKYLLCTLLCRSLFVVLDVIGPHSFFTFYKAWDVEADFELSTYMYERCIYYKSTTKALPLIIPFPTLSIVVSSAGNKALIGDGSQ